LTGPGGPGPSDGSGNGLSDGSSSGNGSGIGPSLGSGPSIGNGSGGPGPAPQPPPSPQPSPSLQPPPFTLYAHRLSHPVEAYGYRLTEPDSRRMLPELLAARGIHGPDISRLKRTGELHGVRLEEVSEPRRGQRFAFVMDTRMCDGVLTLAQDCDLLAIEATFLDEDAALAEEYGHLTAGQAGRAAAEAGVRSLVLTHFSQRYSDASLFARQARRGGFEGELTVAEDLTRVPVPKRRD
jgi:ribonuclease Z